MTVAPLQDGSRNSPNPSWLQKEQNSHGHFLLSKEASNDAVDEVNEPSALFYVCYPVSEFDHLYFVGSSYIQGEKY